METNETPPSPNRGSILIASLKPVALLFAGALLGGFVIHQHHNRQSAPTADDPFVWNSSDSVMVSTKSGRIAMSDNALISGTKAAVFIDSSAEVPIADAQDVLLAPGSKSMALPIFSKRANEETNGHAVELSDGGIDQLLEYDPPEVPTSQGITREPRYEPLIDPKTYLK